jgi:hypothetical protein
VLVPVGAREWDAVQALDGAPGLAPEWGLEVVGEQALVQVPVGAREWDAVRVLDDALGLEWERALA